MKDNIILLTGNDNFFGQTRKPWVSLDVDKLHTEIEKQDFPVEKYSFHEITNGKKIIKDSIIFYSWSQKENRRSYIKDLIRHLDDGSNVIIPSAELLECHENKGYQELYKKKIGLSALKSYYFSSIKELDFYDLQFPLVLKTVDGSNGKGVYLVKNRQQLKNIVHKLESQQIFTLLDLIRRKYFRRKKHYKDYPDYSNRTDYYQYRDYILNEKNFILQEFIPNLTYDYRVLVFYDKYFVMKRQTRHKDFRASGTKMFEFDLKFPDSLLDYAKAVYRKFNSPFLSLDICEHNDNYYLFEFQGLHFGISAVIRSKGYYKFAGTEWQFCEAKSTIETEIAIALGKYINSLSLV